jgi:hypothetical protein
MQWTVATLGVFILSLSRVWSLDTIKVETQTPSPLGESHIERLGIGHSLFMDTPDVAVRGKGLDCALQRMGIHYVRYGAGDIFWSRPPFPRPEPTLAHTGTADWPANDRKVIAADRHTFLKRPADFDQAMELFRKIKAEPILIVPYDPILVDNTGKRNPPTKAEALAAAVAWVRYSNVEKKYGVKYWEIGNETYLNQYFGYTTAEQYAEDLVDFSKAMKAVDPAILIGAVGPGSKGQPGKRDEEQGRKDSWWQTVLTKAGPHLDWLSIHDYPCWHWGKYNYTAEHDVHFDGPLNSVDAGLQAWGPKDRHIPIIVTEMNSADWAALNPFDPKMGDKNNPGWPHIGNLGHALVLFDMIEMYTRHPNCQAALLWNTRWIDKGAQTEHQLWDALDANNELTIIGEVLEMWNSRLGGTRVTCASQHPIKCVAVTKDGKLTIAVFNRAMEAREARLEIDKPKWTGTVTTWTSANVDDVKAQWSKPESIAVDDGAAQLHLLAHGIQFIELREATH